MVRQDQQWKNQTVDNGRLLYPEHPAGEKAGHQVKRRPAVALRKIENDNGYRPSRTTGLRNVPMPVISISTVSPCLKFSGAPSVPIHTTSPG